MVVVICDITSLGTELKTNKIIVDMINAKIVLQTVLGWVRNRRTGISCRSLFCVKALRGYEVSQHCNEITQNYISLSDHFTDGFALTQYLSLVAEKVQPIR